MKIIILLLISSSIFATKIKFKYNERVNLIRFIGVDIVLMIINIVGGINIGCMRNINIHVLVMV